MNQQQTTLTDRLDQHPQLRNRVEEILNIVENTAGNYTNANDAEQSVIDELRKLGNDALSCWAETAVKRSEEKLHQEVEGLHGKGKKKSVGIVLSVK